MTIGIYCLTFTGTDYVYIGQSHNIENRYKEHLTELRCGTSNYKMSAAYVLFGQPELTILENCELNELDDYELMYISKYNSVHKGLNCFNGTTPRTEIKKGYIPVKSKYDEQTYYNILKACIANPNSPPRFIAELTNTDSITVSGIRNIKSHRWMEQRFPEEYKQLLIIYNTPKKKIEIQALKQKVEKPTTIPKEKEYYPTILSPQDIEYTLEKGAARQFAKEHKLPYTSLNKLLNKRIDTCAGWILA